MTAIKASPFSPTARTLNMSVTCNSAPSSPVKPKLRLQIALPFALSSANSLPLDVAAMSSFCSPN